ncbi:hypothetical protein BN1058_01459 [Paraliobacillus sp. PM-2]|uniref:YesL family protein n=1 Tax=Paraliobacillus sp. PM-2 TaxID=1462524 RepID=UPI00061C2A41|nr:DUF624 domain-containing protein [Paraliobacillus sp. PM-2]CQR47168.1 hypothetical protein BN1058_01459 [Paraliobacillus sp. PM-2]
MNSIFSSDSKLMQFMEWITKMLHVQILWVLGTLLGLVIGGIFPATFAMFAINRKWVLGQDFAVGKTFFQTYKENFLKANGLGFGLGLVGASFIYYMNLFSAIGGITSIVLVVITFTFILLFLMTLLFIIPVYVHFNISIPEVVKHALVMSISNPLHVLLMVLTFIGFWFLTDMVPVLLPFIGISVFTYILMRIAIAAFISVEKKINEQHV